ncbi:MAG: TonB-dependent receptor [Pseudomonadota bacterium]
MYDSRIQHTPSRGAARPWMQTWLTSAVISVLTVMPSGHANAQDERTADTTTNDVAEIVVYGRAQSQIGNADAASQGFIGQDDIRLPPRLRVGDLVEVVPGMVATQHSGTGKANQYFARGFNLDHGTDFSVTVDGVPINMPSHGHGQGYLDLNFLIPETVRATRYRRGPYAAEVGDFSSAASVAFSLVDRFEQSTFSTSWGSFGEQRLLAAGSAELTNSELTGAVEGSRYDGPWVQPEGLSQHKAYVAYSMPLANADVRFTWQGYDSAWNATDQIPTRAVAAGLISRFGNLDDDLGGSTTRHAFSVDSRSENWTVNAYAIDYRFQLFSNFTYFLDNPFGDEFEQSDKRRVYGLDIRSADDARSERWHINWGANLRIDDVKEVGLYETMDRIRTNTVRQDALRQRSLGAWAEADGQLTARLRAVFGGRIDAFDWDVNARLIDNSGTGADLQFSPKASLIWEPSDRVALYLNYGRGFHSNDVRGATMSTDPRTREPLSAVPVLVASDGIEAGVRYESQSGFNATLTLFRLDLDGELVYVGDAGTTEPGNPTQRIGYEAEMFWQATDALAINAAFATTDATLLDSDPGLDRIPGAVASTATIGLNSVWANGWSASARLRWLEGAPLVEDGSVTGADSTLLNIGVAYRRGAAEIRLDVLNALDSRDADVAYYFESRLPGEDNAVEDIHFHPLVPRALRATLTWRW